MCASQKACISKIDVFWLQILCIMEVMCGLLKNVHNIAWERRYMHLGKPELVETKSKKWMLQKDIIYVVSINVRI